jgi:hypothetical protein
MVRKNGIKINKHVLIGGKLASSRFSGQMSVHNVGIAKKRYPPVHGYHPGTYEALRTGKE